MNTLDARIGDDTMMSQSKSIIHWKRKICKGALRVKRDFRVRLSCDSLTHQCQVVLASHRASGLSPGADDAEVATSSSHYSLNPRLAYSLGSAWCEQAGVWVHTMQQCSLPVHILFREPVRGTATSGRELVMCVHKHFKPPDPQRDLHLYCG